jgi:hypothetical protein
VAPPAADAPPVPVASPLANEPPLPVAPPLADEPPLPVVAPPLLPCPPLPPPEPPLFEEHEVVCNAKSVATTNNASTVLTERMANSRRMK